MRSFVIVIRSGYFGAKKHRKYAKSVGVNRSAKGEGGYSVTVNTLNPQTLPNCTG